MCYMFCLIAIIKTQLVFLGFCGFWRAFGEVFRSVFKLNIINIYGVCVSKLFDWDQEPTMGFIFMINATPTLL